MFWKKKQAEEKPAKAKAEPPKPKVKQLSPKEIIINQIEQIGPVQSLTYQLAEYLMDRFAIVELNPEYPGKGRKYIVSSDRMVDGKPAGQKTRLWDSSKPKDVASWILEKNGVLFTPAGEGAISS